MEFTALDYNDRPAIAPALPHGVAVRTTPSIRNDSQPRELASEKLKTRAHKGVIFIKQPD